MGACNILFTPKNEGIVRIKLNVALRTNNISSFTDFISRYKYGENKVRLVPNEGDPEDEAIQSLRDLDNSIQNILKSWDAAHHNTLRYDEVLSTIRDALGIEDASQTATVESDLEIKTKQEEADKNTTNLQKHLVEFYGQEAFDIIKSLHERFADTVTSIAYYDVSSGIVLSQDNESLNARIKEQKSALFRSMVTYLKKQFPDNKAVQSLSENMYINGNFNRDTYYRALNLFYSLVARQPNFKDSLAQANAALITEQEKQNKIELYKKLVQTLRQDEHFVKNMSSKFTGMRNVLLGTQLYQGDHFSEYYAAVKDHITRYKPELANAITEIEQGNLSILDAANAYTMLTHFDELLKENYGDQISVSEGTFGFEGDIPNKYSYHVDTSHERKGWQTSEDIGSEKHIAKFTQTVLQSIRIYNWKSGEFMNRRANSTAAIVAFRNLLNALQNRQMHFDTGSDIGQKLTRELNGCVIEFHDHPVKNLQRILELLFEKQPGMRNSLMNLLSSKSVVNDFDLSIIKSVYDTVFNKNLANSFYSQATTAGRTFKQGTDVLLNEIAGFVDRNITCTYLETSIDTVTGEVLTQPKKKFFNNKEVYLIQTRINNRLNNYEGDRQKLQDDYGFAINEGTGPRTEYTVTIGGNQVSVSIPDFIPGQIIDTYSGNNSKMKVTAPADFFNKLQEVNIDEFRYKILHGLSLSENEALLKDTLQFLDDTLDLGILSNPSIGLQILGTYKEIYRPIDQMNNFLMPLLKLGIRATYINSQYLKAGNKGLREYLQSTFDPIYRHYLKNSNTSKMFRQRFGNLRYSAATYNDTVIGMWADAKSILFGEASKATTKDSKGNFIPNNSVAKMGGLLKYYTDKQWDTNTESLFFVRNSYLITETFHDLEVTNMHMQTKSIRDLSLGELAFHAIFNKFYGSYLNSHDKEVIIQPTVYSDKTTFLNWKIKTTLDGKDLVRADFDTILDLYVETLGKTYQKIYDSTVDKLTKITTHWMQSQGRTEAKDFRDVLHEMTEEDLVNAATQLGLTVELKKDYQIINTPDGKRVGINGLLAYNASLYNDKKALRTKLNSEKKEFLQQLLNCGSQFQVLTGNDTLDMFTEDELPERMASKNPVLDTILKFFDLDTTNEGMGTRVDRRIAYMKTWVDESTGRLILAKQGGKNILTNSDEISSTGTVELNPLLDKFFNLEGFYANNLRASLTGFEINHSAGKKSPFTIAKATDSLEAFNALGTYDTITDREWKYLHTEDHQGLLDKALDVDHLQRLSQNDSTLPKEVAKIVQQIIKDTYEYDTDTAQGTQFKRNVIIPATLQYCLQKTRNGIPPKIKCAVIRDMPAHVYNYRGDHEADIDACDGSAQINPFQSILENKSLGSQAVGFIKKPIWHAYDADSGTAFLAKFATDTITNESMRLSANSSLNLHNLFKKMTNLQWDDPRIDLTKSIIAEQSWGGEAQNLGTLNKWFSSVILGNQKLYYLNKYGKVVQITRFNKTTTADGTTLYYTKEVGTDNNESTKYHIFYDEGGKTSIHTTTDTWQQALVKIKQLKEAGLNPHTINSLYELHTALGGIYCCDASGKGSEFNNEVVVNFMNNVGWLKEGQPKGQYIDQDSYVQPLKQYHIGYALNETAVKNGVKNINSVSRWTDDKALTYFEVDSDGLGMQMNADHDIVDAELTEFSQVIAATAAYGYTYDQCHEIFQGLAKTALQSSQVVIDAVNDFVKATSSDNSPQLVNDLYDAVGRIIMVNQSIKDGENLTNIIMEAVTKIFNKHKDHTKDEVKIPFSDPNIYKNFIATLASTITNQSIKRKHPGSGCVMVPAYDMIQYFELVEKDPTGKFVYKKYMAGDILKKARARYEQDLVALIKQQSEYDSKAFRYKKGNIDINPDYTSIAELEAVALRIVPDGSFSKYYTAAENNTEANNFLIKTYLQEQQSTAPTFTSAEYFMPSDIVDVLDKDGNLIETVDLNSLEVYYKFKSGSGITTNQVYPPDCTYRINVTRPHNLRPSLIRWQYKDSDGVLHYKNIFDLAVIKNAYANPENLKSPKHRKAVQDILHNLHEGIFVDDDGTLQKIEPGTLENTEAELIMSNLYKETFGIEDESLAEVLEQGENYFKRQARNLKSPVSYDYDIAFLRENGKHTLLTTGPVQPKETIRENPFGNNTFTNAQGEIYLTRNGQNLFKIGKWQYDDTVVYDEATQKFESTDKKELDQAQYRIYEGRVQKRYDYVTRYTLLASKKTKNGTIYQNNTLYKIADIDTIKKALNITEEKDDKHAIAQQASIINAIYMAGDYKLAQIHPAKKFSEGQQHALENAIQLLLTNKSISSDVRVVLQKQLVMLGNDNTATIKAFVDAKEEFLQKEAHKRYVSFLDSTKFISSRIPAQTLQSFMAMRLVGWTENSNNMAYVSHFQTYLQGSGYDIDKANLMGQSYDSNSLYVKWSPFFDYTSLSTLEASKTLPIPKNISVYQTEDGVDITSEIDGLLENFDLDLETRILSAEGKSEAEKLNFLKFLRQALLKIEKSEGNFSYKGKADKKGLSNVLYTFIGHEKYNIPYSVAEAAFKNVASANIYAVSHDIRNRDQAYTAITMNDMRSAADKSPKGEQASRLNMLNPLAKYVMQYQNLVGKNVIGIAANGEKYWFNLYFYWNRVLQSGNEDDIKYLKFFQTLHRVKDRAKSNPKSKEIVASTHTVNYIPDLNVRDTQIKDMLVQHFGVDPESEEYHYVDQLISQFLTAATDNAEELVLAKLNAGTNFAKMYLYLITLGYNLDDIAAFMCCPVAEFIYANAASNMFLSTSTENTAFKAINLALGKVSSRDFMHGIIVATSEEERSISKIAAMKNSLYYAIEDEERLKQEVLKNLEPPADTDILKLDLETLMQGVILTAVKTPMLLSTSKKIDLVELLGDQDDIELNNYIRYCQDLIQQLRQVIVKYGANHFNDYIEDTKEFRKIFYLASEMSNIAYAFLGLNQGVPTYKLSMIKRLQSMRCVVTSREIALGIRGDVLFGETDSEFALARRQTARIKVQENILSNNPDLDSSEVWATLEKAYNAGIMNHFDVVKMLTAPEYKQLAKDYLHIIKGTANVIDMMDKIPHYAEIMELFKAVIVADRSLASVSRLVDRLTDEGYTLTGTQLQGILRYANSLNILNFLENCTPVVTHKDCVGFNSVFDQVSVSCYDLSTMHGIAGFKHFVETEFLDYLKTSHTSNPLVPHLTKTINEGRDALTVDIDLMNPDVTAASRLAYDEILRGMAQFEKIKYANSGYTIADIFQLYNLIVNRNQYGGERLTTAFKVCSDQNNVLNRYFKFTAERDIDYNFTPEYALIDYQINAAPLVSSVMEKFSRDPFIKVKDSVWDYVIKKYEEKVNIYKEYSLLPAFSENGIPAEQRNQRRINYMNNCPFEMPIRARVGLAE